MTNAEILNTAIKKNSGYYTLSPEHLNDYAKIKCSCCGIEVTLSAILGGDYENKRQWNVCTITNAKFCGYCSAELGLSDTRES